MSVLHCMARFKMLWLTVIVTCVLFNTAKTQPLQPNPLSLDSGIYIQSLFQTYMKFHGGSLQANCFIHQFAVLTMGRIDEQYLRPYPPQFWYRLSSKNLCNYYAAKPYYDASLRRKKHSEEQLIDKFDELKKIHGINSMSNHIHDVYILTYNSPCNDCARDLKNLANNNPNIHFHIGYMQEYINRNQPNKPTIGNTRRIFSQQLNVYFGDVSQYCQNPGPTPSPTPSIGRKRRDLNVNRCGIIIVEGKLSTSLAFLFIIMYSMLRSIYLFCNKFGLQTPESCKLLSIQ